MWGGNSFVEIRPASSDGRCKLRLVTLLGREKLDNGKYKQIRRYETTPLYLWNKSNLSSFEREHNRTVKEAAKKIREKRERELQTMKNGYEFVEDRKNVNFFEWFKDYIADYDKADKRVMEMALKRFKSFISSSKKYDMFKDTINPDQITEELINCFVARLKKDCRGTGAASVYKRFKKAVKYATKKHIFLSNPCDGISIKEDDGKRLLKDVLTDDEIITLLHCRYEGQSEEVRRAFIFCLYTGLRFCDVKELRYANMDYNGLQLTFRQSKTGKINVVPIREDLLPVIGDGESNNSIFRLGSANGCNKSLQHWVARAGIDKHITWHCARHSFGANTYYKLKDLRATSELLGHSSTKITQVYTQVFDDRKRELVNSLPAIE